jgi:hypothetical protein
VLHLDDDRVEGMVVVFLLLFLFTKGAASEEGADLQVLGWSMR